METSKRITLINKDSYKVDLEYNDMYAILHLPVVPKFTKTVYLDMVSTIKDIRDFLEEVGYVGLWTAVEPSNKIINKLVNKLGFKYMGDSEGYSVYLYEENV